MSWNKSIRRTSVPVAFSPVEITPLRIDWNKVVTLDFETYFDNDYTLKKMSTSEYVRDPRFKAHMVGIKIGRKKTVVVHHKHIQAALNRIDWNIYAMAAHNTLFDGLICSHHYGVIPTFYIDTLAMARGLYGNEIGAGLDEVAQYLNKGSKTPDILEKTRGVLEFPPDLKAETTIYCGNDVDLTFDILVDMHAITPGTEMKLINMTTRMFCDPVLLVDRPRVQIELDREIKEREDMLMSIDVSNFPDKSLKVVERSLPDKEKRILKAKKIVGSGEKFADLLRAEGIEPPVKISPSWLEKKPEDRDPNKKWAYAFAKDDAAFIELPTRIDLWAPHLDRDNVKHLPEIVKIQDRVQALVDVRIAVKSTTNLTRAQRFLNASEDGCSLPVGYAYARAHTYRWGGNNKMNMQNLKRGGELRLAIMAPPGYNLSVVDSGQIECRVNGWLWNQDDLMDAFRDADSGKGRDAYCKFADVIYGRVITKADTMERFVGKVGVLGLGFQMGADKLQMTLAKGALGGPPVFFSLDRCKSIVNAYRRKNHRIVDGWAKCTQIIEDMAAGVKGSWKCLHWEEGRIWGPDGTCLKYPDLRLGKNAEKGWDEWTYDSKGLRKKIYGGLLCENIVQWLARMIVATQMLEIDERNRVVMMTHDEAVAITRTKNAPACFAHMTKAFRTAPIWCSDIPLNSEGGYAQNYSK